MLHWNACRVDFKVSNRPVAYTHPLRSYHA
jgi:hypothetical protein